jgi:F-type H+-transporting ATPase subunit delta
VPHIDMPKVIAGKQAVLARRYAAALLELAQEKNVVEAVESDMRALQEAIEANPRFRVMVTHPRLPLAEILKTVEKIIVASKCNNLTAAFLRQVTHNRRLAYIGVIIDVFKKDLAVQRREHVAVVVVAHKITKTQEDKLAGQLGRLVDGSVRLIVEEDESLIGGMTIKMDSRLIDASVQGKLARLERQLKSQQEAA